MTVNERFSPITTLQFLLSKQSIELKLTGKVMAILSKAQDKKLMVGVIGESGIGKSTAIANKVLGCKNVYYISSGPAAITRSLFIDLAFAISGKMPIRGATIDDLIHYIGRLLTENDDEKLIIIDEAGKLKQTGLALFHQLRDYSRPTTGFAFFGPEYFRDHLLQWRKRGNIGIGEFYRRIDYWFSLPHLTIEEKTRYVKSRKLEINNELLKIINSVTLIWELEQQVNIYIEKTMVKRIESVNE